METGRSRNQARRGKGLTKSPTGLHSVCGPPHPPQTPVCATSTQAQSPPSPSWSKPAASSSFLVPGQTATYKLHPDNCSCSFPKASETPIPARPRRSLQGLAPPTTPLTFPSTTQPTRPVSTALPSLMAAGPPGTAHPHLGQGTSPLPHGTRTGGWEQCYPWDVRGVTDPEYWAWLALTRASALLGGDRVQVRMQRAGADMGSISFQALAGDRSHPAQWTVARHLGGASRRGQDPRPCHPWEQRQAPDP